MENCRVPLPPTGTPTRLLAEEMKSAGIAEELTVKLKSPEAVSEPAVAVKGRS